MPKWVYVQEETTERRASECVRSGYLYFCGAEVRRTHREADNLADAVASDGLVEFHSSFFRCLRVTSCVNEESRLAKVSDLPEVETAVFTRQQLV